SVTDQAAPVFVADEAPGASMARYGRYVPHSVVTSRRTAKASVRAAAPMAIQYTMSAASKGRRSRPLKLMWINLALILKPPCSFSYQEHGRAAKVAERTGLLVKARGRRWLP